MSTPERRFANFGAGTFLYAAYPAIASALVRWLSPLATNMKANRILPTSITAFIDFLLVDVTAPDLKPLLQQ
jgi:hypothetical protein